MLLGMMGLNVNFGVMLLIVNIVGISLFVGMLLGIGLLMLVGMGV